MHRSVKRGMSRGQAAEAAKLAQLALTAFQKGDSKAARKRLEEALEV